MRETIKSTLAWALMQVLDTAQFLIRSLGHALMIFLVVGILLFGILAMVKVFTVMVCFFWPDSTFFTRCGGG